ncbi:MAG TPA: PAS domain S-box protein [Pantanalinema sp.]
MRRRAELLDVIHDAVTVRDLSNRITFWNRGAELLYGWSSAEVIGQVAHHLLRTRFPSSFEEVMSALHRTGQWEGELLHFRRDGSAMDVASRWILRRDEAGTPYEIAVICNDITAKKQAEVALSDSLRERETLFRGILEASPDSIVLVDPRGVIVLVNPEAERTFGYRQDELIGRRIELLVPDRYRTQHVTDRTHYAEHARMRPMGIGLELRARRKDGSELPIEVSLSPLSTGSGHVMAVVRDITERKRAEQEIERLRRLQRREFELMVKSVKEYAIFMIGPDGRIVTWNEGATKTTGYHEAEVLGQPVDILFTPEDVQAGRPRRVLEEALSRGNAEEEGWRVRKDGTRYLANVTTTAMFDERGRHVGFARIIRDLTQRKIIEEIQGRLKVLEETDRMKDEFLSVISHELRTPLNLITGFASIIEDETAGPLTSEQRAYLGKIMSGADRMLVLINNLLDVSRIVAGSFTLSPAPTLYMPIVSQVLNTLEPILKEKGQRIACDVAVPGEIEIDGQRIVQVLTNLVENASKFTAPGGEIAVRAYLNGTELVTEVSDTGIGIAAEDLSKLFRRFMQLDMSMTRSAGGSGLGLSICKAIVEAHGGRIGARSEGLGKGSTFWFTLPLREHAD